jgi:DNA polymerase (family 10)
MTERVLRAVRSPHVDVLGHPTCRRLDRRGETAVDLERVIVEAARCGTVLEINSSPMRLDLNDSWARRAQEAGATLAIDSDAHYPAEFDYAPFGCAIGRRAGLTRERVLNTRNAAGLLAYCAEKASKRTE